MARKSRISVISSGKYLPDNLSGSSKITNCEKNATLTPQGQLSLQGTFSVWTDVSVLWTKADEGEAGMYDAKF